MVKPIPARFNPDLLAREAARFGAEIPLSEFTRLSACLASVGDSATESVDSAREGSGVVKTEFTLTRRKDHVLAIGTLESVYPLECQRCLALMELPVNGQFELTFVDDEATANDLPDTMDPVLLDDKGHIALVDMLEDELLLLLPVVARHEMGSEQCGASGDFEAAPPATELPTRKPFEALKDLKKELKFTK